MEIARAYKFGVYPDAKRRSEIDERLLLAQRLYNKFLEQTVPEEHRTDKTRPLQDAVIA